MGMNFSTQAHSDLIKELYKGSLDDISEMIYCIEQLRNLNRTLIYTGREGYYSETIRLCRLELKDLVKYHKDKFDEEVDLRVITERVKGIAMRIREALIIINHIENSGVNLSENENRFIYSIKNMGTKILTQKQADWLKLIYKRVIE